jgi:hypothetical protein
VQFDSYSHSIIPWHDNVLICQHKVFLHLSKNRIPDPSENRALEFKGEFPQFGIRSVSATIDIDRSIFDVSGNQ